MNHVPGQASEMVAQNWVANFALTCAARFGLFFALFQIEPLFPLFLEEMGASPIMIGMVMAAFPFGATVVRPVVGSISIALAASLFCCPGS